MSLPLFSSAVGAARFKVSRKTTAPAGTRTQRLWYKGATDMVELVRPNRHLSKDTLAHELFQSEGYAELSLKSMLMLGLTIRTRGITRWSRVHSGQLPTWL
jgi:hypothetical protein